jgi:hypothetical protein
MVGDPELEKFKDDVGAALRTILGDSGAKAILFYIGDPTPDTFEAKLRSILGNGAGLITQELKRQAQAEAGRSKHRWLGGRS